MGVARLKPFVDGVWLATQPITIVGMKLTVSMAVLDLVDDELLIFSPIGHSPELEREVSRLGRVTHLYSPNLFHHLWLGEWSSAFPLAKVHAPVDLPRKRPDLRIDRLVSDSSEPEPAFAGVLDEVTINGFRLQETVLTHWPARTLIVADLVHNVGRPPGAWTGFYTRVMGFHDRVALSRMIRWTAFSDRQSAKESMDRVLELDFDRLVVGHGEPLESGGKQAIREAYAWLTGT